jgi:ferrous iron transport protein A
MPDIDLTVLKAGRTALVKEIHGSAAVVNRLDAMGIFAGMTLVKKSGFFRHGPIVVEIGRSRIALGRGTACRIFVEPVA